MSITENGETISPWPAPADKAAPQPDTSPHVPPPPPPAPSRDNTAGDWPRPPHGNSAAPPAKQTVESQRRRSTWRELSPNARASALVVVALAVVMFAARAVPMYLKPQPLAVDQKSTLEALYDVVQGIKAEIPPVVVVPDPLNYGCELTGDAMGLIGGSDATNGRTLDPARVQQVAARVKEQLAAGISLRDLRLTSPDGKSLVVSQTQGQKIFNCDRPYQGVLKQTEVPTGNATTTTVGAQR